MWRFYLTCVCIPCNIGDDEGDEKLALALLCVLLLKKQKGSPHLMYIYEQCQVKIST